MDRVAGEIFNGTEARVVLPKGIKEGFLFLLKIPVRRRLGCQADEKVFHQGGDGGIALGGYDASLPVGVVITGNGDVFHIFTVSQFHELTPFISGSNISNLSNERAPKAVECGADG